MDLYQHELMDHYRFPRNRGLLDPADFVSQVHNPSCGDSVVVSGRCANNILTRIGFEGTGCVISIASASLFFELCLGRPLDELIFFDKDVVLRAIGIELGPTRLRCALLSMQALQQGLQTLSESPVHGIK